ncbi:MAG: segregation/condensation protein A [Planctomycetota bacterium]
MSDYKVTLQLYSGPLDLLLLYLLRQRELDVKEISVAEVTEQYLQYLDLIRELDLNFAAEFLVMAASLMLMKVRSVLPSEDISLDEEGEDEEGAPGIDLIRQLLEYKKFKDAAALLRERAAEQELRVGRQLSADFESRSVEDVLENVSLWDLMKAFREILEATGVPPPTVSLEEDVPVSVCMDELIALLRASLPNEILFQQAFAQRRSRIALIGMFLAILELARLRRIRISQDARFGEIRISLRSETEWENVPANHAQPSEQAQPPSEPEPQDVPPA